jgi:hypothetical protein
MDACKNRTVPGLPGLTSSFACITFQYREKGTTKSAQSENKIGLAKKSADLIRRHNTDS